MRNLTVRLTSDNQIEVQVGTESRTGECYYLGLRSEMDQPESGSAELAEGVRELLRGWLSVLMQMSDGEQVFLPFDFSDEYTRWLTVHRRDREATVVFGWADVEGWAISPTNPAEYSKALPGFQPDDPLHVQTFYLPGLIGDLRCALLNIQ